MSALDLLHENINLSICPQKEELVKLVNVKFITALHPPAEVSFVHGHITHCTPTINDPRGTFFFWKRLITSKRKTRCIPQKVVN